MALLSRVKLNGFRNLESVELCLAPGFNLFIGANGSGKTSLLEALHVLGTGRSFRTNKLDPLINDLSDHFVIFTEINEGGIANKVGLKRSRNASPVLRFNEQTQASWSLVAAALPLQLINSDSFAILEGGGKARRRFLDWALFHVEHSYLIDWRAYRRVVAQRNILLKQRGPKMSSQLDAWDNEMGLLGEIIHRRRVTLIDSFQAQLQILLDRLLPGLDFQLEYRKGWPEQASLIEVLQKTRDRDLRYGVSLSGPHRGDFSIRVNRHAATDTLSRGQTKLLVIALKLAMGELVKVAAGSSNRPTGGPLYLIDDLAAELDVGNCSKVISYLHEQNDQCLFTAITESALPGVTDLIEASGKFHVEHGKISACPATA